RIVLYRLVRHPELERVVRFPPPVCPVEDPGIPVRQPHVGSATEHDNLLPCRIERACSVRERADFSRASGNVQQGPVLAIPLPRLGTTFEEVRAEEQGRSRPRERSGRVTRPFIEHARIGPPRIARCALPIDAIPLPRDSISDTMPITSAT